MMQPITHITAGQAGKTDVRHINDLVIEQMALIPEVVNGLIDDGHTVIGVRVEPTGGLPTVQLAASESLSWMVERNEACYYKRRSDQVGVYRTGQFQRAGVKVVWIEIESH